MPPLPKGEAFSSKNCVKIQFIGHCLCYTPVRTKKTEEGTGMKDVELRYVGGHVEVYTEAGAFLFSADTLREAMEELDAA